MFTIVSEPVAVGLINCLTSLVTLITLIYTVVMYRCLFELSVNWNYIIVKIRTQLTQTRLFICIATCVVEHVKVVEGYSSYPSLVSTHVRDQLCNLKQLLLGMSNSCWRINIALIKLPSLKLVKVGQTLNCRNSVNFWPIWAFLIPFESPTTVLKYITAGK